MTSFAIIIISVNFQLKQLSGKFLPLTISYSCCSIPTVYLLWYYSLASTASLIVAQVSQNRKLYNYLCHASSVLVLLRILPLAPRQQNV